MRYIRAECRSCFDHADFSAENIACGLSIEPMKRRAGDGRTIKIYINTARIEVPFMWGSLRLAPISCTRNMATDKLYMCIRYKME